MWNRTKASFSSSPVFGPVARNNAGARNSEVTILDFSRSSYDGKHVKAQWSGPALIVNTDEVALTVPIAEAAVSVIRGEIKGISRTIKPSTARYRGQAKRSYEKGASWARARYKDRPPGEAGSDQLYNDSGSLAAKVRMDVRKGVAVVTQIDDVRQPFVVTHNLKALVPAMRTGLGKYPQIKKALTRVLKNAARVYGKRTLGGKRAERIGGSK